MASSSVYINTAIHLNRQQHQYTQHQNLPHHYMVDIDGDAVMTESNGSPIPHVPLPYVNWGMPPSSLLHQGKQQQQQQTINLPQFQTLGQQHNAIVAPQSEPRFDLTSGSAMGSVPPMTGYSGIRFATTLHKTGYSASGVAGPIMTMSGFLGVLWLGMRFYRVIRLGMGRGRIQGLRTSQGAQCQGRGRSRECYVMFF
ncbi:hypothetical protein BC829DRAFT_402442 [Chytridium lagenaria]|nr:hypothetical protein BC829DRAFT_402442 [Chytridium lagenaria]